MYCNFKQEIWLTYNLASPKLSTYRSFFTNVCFLSRLREIPRILSRSLYRSFLSRQIIVLVLMAFLTIPFSSHALTSKTVNVINGNAPYFTFDGGRTRITDGDDLLVITLSNGDKYTSATNTSSETNPIILPNVGQSFADIGMLMPIDTDDILLDYLVRAPYHYWNDDDGDGDGQDPDRIRSSGNLHLSIVDKNEQFVGRNEVLNICKAPYELTLSASTGGDLTTFYGVPNLSRFRPGHVTYYISPKISSPVICFAKVHPERDEDFAGPSSMWDMFDGFLPQSFSPSDYEKNFPTTGANNMYFDLQIAGVAEPLEWEVVSPNAGIKVTMTNSTNKSVHVTLTGPAVEDPSQQISDNPTRLDKLSLPQVFELVGKGKDSDNNDIELKYGFVLKQWFVNRGTSEYSYSSTSSWCTKIGYRMPAVMDLTNANCQHSNRPDCRGAVSAKPLSSNHYFQRHIGAGFFTEWGEMIKYNEAGFRRPGSGHTGWHEYWTGDVFNRNHQFIVDSIIGYPSYSTSSSYLGLCVYP